MLRTVGVRQALALGIVLSILGGVAAQPPGRPRDERPREAPPKPDPTVDAWVKVLTEKMLDRHDAVRDSARAALVAIGRPALPALKKLADGDDTAAAAAAHKLMARIEGGHDDHAGHRGPPPGPRMGFGFGGPFGHGPGGFGGFAGPFGRGFGGPGTFRRSGDGDRRRPEPPAPPRRSDERRPEPAKEPARPAEPAQPPTPPPGPGGRGFGGGFGGGGGIGGPGGFGGGMAGQRGFGGGGFGRFALRSEWLEQELGLTDQQKEKVKAVLADHEKRMREAITKLREGNERVDPESFRKATQARDEELLKDLRPILTGEQLDKLKKALERPGPMGPGGPGRPDRE